MSATHVTDSSTMTAPALFLALELSWTTWKLAFTVGAGQKPRLRSIPARDTDALICEIRAARRWCGLPEEAPVISCYQAGRDGSGSIATSSTTASRTSSSTPPPSKVSVHYSGSLGADVAGNLLVPLINKKAIKAEYLSATPGNCRASTTTSASSSTPSLRLPTACPRWRITARASRSRSSSWNRSRPRSKPPADFFGCRADYVDVLFAQRDLNGCENGLGRNQTAATVCHRKHLSSPRRRRFCRRFQPGTAAISP